MTIGGLSKNVGHQGSDDKKLEKKHLLKRPEAVPQKTKIWTKI